MVFCQKKSLMVSTLTSSELSARPWEMISRTCTNASHSFAFATVDPTTFEVKATSTGAQDLMVRIGNLKFLQPDLKIWIAIGGWSFSDNDQPTAKTFSALSGSKQRQRVFANSLISMMSTYGFDGVDIDWVSILLHHLYTRLTVL
jgi:GH18 family chitinase